ncbi:ninja-family protein AFP3-like [Salvia miltiorrhiza]|uniref:ninja-family protein AFP3-like n=1 Tax=Salvia miltiorrhiza TaxID=226208 RepID=UPI0025AC86CA|nr:ninja-family protein AFP3-like [Salvia miltiorrhiza]
MESGEGKRERLSLSMGMKGISSDPLQKLMKEDGKEREAEEEEEDEEELELSLGLSLNGRFGVDPMRKRLKRSSSISNFVFAVDNGGGEAELARTRSLPAEEWRRRKEFQSMRRMAARKKRMEKLRNVRVQHKEKECCNEGVSNGYEISSSQGSIGSTGSGSSGISDLDFEGGSQKADVPPPTIRPPQDQSEGRAAADRDAKLPPPPPSKSLKNVMCEMPYVSTKGDGPEGHKIEGFLYRYKKGEEVRIVCVCHGMFLTPAEFIKHGGGGDVEHPLKHIVVNPFPLL